MMKKMFRSEKGSTLRDTVILATRLLCDLSVIVVEYLLQFPYARFVIPEPDNLGVFRLTFFQGEVFIKTPTGTFTLAGNETRQLDHRPFCHGGWRRFPDSALDWIREAQYDPGGVEITIYPRKVRVLANVNSEKQESIFETGPHVENAFLWNHQLIFNYTLTPNLYRISSEGTLIALPVTRPFLSLWYSWCVWKNFIVTSAEDNTLYYFDLITETTFSCECDFADEDASAEISMLPVHDSLFIARKHFIYVIKETNTFTPGCSRSTTRSFSSGTLSLPTAGE